MLEAQNFLILFPLFKTTKRWRNQENETREFDLNT